MTSISSSVTSNHNYNSDQNPFIQTKLNPKAPEFIPMNSNSPSPSSSPGPGDQPRLPPPSPPSVYVPIRGSGTYYPSPSPSPPHYAEQRYRKKQTGKDDQPPSGSLSRNNSAGYSGGSLSRSSSTGGGGYYSDGDASYGLSDEATNKLINQVEYYFSDVNLATTDHLIKFIFKDPEGFVPISVVSSFKKIKALISSNSQLAAVLRNSTKLEVSEDGKKVKRVHRLASSDMEELQARIIVAENLPDDHCHQNLMKIFSVVGGVKSIRTCLPQPSSNATSPARSSKTDSYHNTKLHAFVEYESVELAEKAIVELNAEDSWRSGLRVRSLLKQAMKPVQGRAMKTGNESEVNDEEVSVSTSESKRSEKLSDLFAAESGAQSPEHGDEQNLDKDGGLKKSRNRTKGKGRGRGHNNNSNHLHQNNRGSQSPVHGEQPVVTKQPPGPRMPDGTRGFSMGRGKPLAVSTS